MNAPTSVTFLLILTLGVVHVSAAETIYFLVAEPPGREICDDSYVLPLSKPEDIGHARYLISLGPMVFQRGDAPLVVARVRAGSNGINRDYTDARFPEWSWHVLEFRGFADYTLIIMDGCPTMIENSLASYNSNDVPEGMIGFWNYTVVRELGPHPLYLSIIPENRQLQFYWTGLGTNYVYTIEGSDSLSSTDWSAVPGASWPLRTNHWVLPQAEATARFYRVTAEESQE